MVARVASAIYRFFDSQPAEVICRAGKGFGARTLILREYFSPKTGVSLCRAAPNKR